MVLVSDGLGRCVARRVACPVDAFFNILKNKKLPELFRKHALPRNIDHFAAPLDQFDYRPCVCFDDADDDEE